MKHCPTCSANFEDDDLGYCTDDGTPLLAGANPFASDAQATKVFPEPPVTAVISPPRATDYGLGGGPSAPVAQPQRPEPYRWANETPPVWTPPPPPAYPSASQQPQQTTAILSLVFGIAAITFGWICGGLILGLLALILGLVSLSQIKRTPTRYGGKPMAIGGMVTGGIVLLVHLAILAIWIVMLAIGSASR